jgi:nitroimidazol reductase NimA-like FMN-containing flavoprotein (pyridoxamine 5'-phosphate oxidase superfamily)
MGKFSMTRAQREAFVADTHVALLAVTAGSRGPLLVPVWYWYRPGGDVHIVTGGASRKMPLLRAARRGGRAPACRPRRRPTST